MKKGIVILFLFFSIFLWADKTFFVAPDGDSNGGSSWSKAFTSIKGAIAYIKNNVSLKDGEKISLWIKEGTYNEYDIEVPENFELYGGFSGTESDLSERDIENHKVIIKSDRKHRVVKNHGILDGLHITGGNAVSNYDDESGGGIYNYGIVKSCKIYKNVAYEGGGIYNNCGTIENCEIYKNLSYSPSSSSAGGGIYNNKGIIEDCRIYKNTAASPNAIGCCFFSTGGGICNKRGTVKNCEIYENKAFCSGGGIDNDNGIINNCKIYGNLADYACGIINSSGGIVKNCLIYKNDEEGIYNMGNSSKVINCTVVGSKTYGIRNEMNALVINTISWGNGKEDIANTIEDIPVGKIINCCYHSGLKHTNTCIDADPKFVSVENNNFHLLPDSPCINAGTDHKDLSSTDIIGNPRIIGTAPDMGCYEMNVIEYDATGYYELPQIIHPDEDFNVLLTVVNIGTSNWDTSDNYELELVDDGGLNIGTTSYSVDSEVESGGSYTFTIPMEGDERGEYICKWQMTRNGKSFGEIIEVKVILIEEKVYYVALDGDNSDGSNWQKGFTSIKNAIKQIGIHEWEKIYLWIKEGTYNEYDVEVPDNFELYGGFNGSENDLSKRDIKKHKVIVKGDKKHRVIKNYGILDGLYITGGYVSGNYDLEGNGGGVYNYGIVRNCEIYENISFSPSSFSFLYGGGIYNSYGIIENCKIYKNMISGDGGGIYNLKGTVENCKIYENNATFSGGGINNGHGTVINCEIYGNTDTSSGGIYNLYGTVENCKVYKNIAFSTGGICNISGIVKNCKIYKNAALNEEGGVYNGNFGIVKNCEIYKNVALNTTGGIYNSCGYVKDCKIYQNVALNNGGMYNDVFGVVESCKIYKNIALNSSGGIYNYGTLQSCRIYENMASLYGGIYNYGSVINCLVYKNNGDGIYNDDTNSEVLNCTVVGNKNNGIKNNKNAIIVNTISWKNCGKDIAGGNVTNCCYHSGIKHTKTCIDADPQFASIENNDFHLLPDSPCINAGANIDDLPSTDIEGNPRIIGSAPDIGCYEYSSSK